MPEDITIPEWINQQLAAQKDAPLREFEWAKRWATYAYNMESDSSAFFYNFFRMRAFAKKTTTRELVRYFAFKWLIHLIINDLMEYAAELGKNTYECLREDKVDCEAGRRPTNVAMLEEITELQLVTTHERPLVSQEIDENPFDPEDELPFRVSIKPGSRVNWDDLSETQWQAEQTAEEEYRQSVLDEYKTLKNNLSMYNQNED